MARVRNPMPDPDNYQDMAAYYRREAASDYRRSAKRQRDAKRYREWATDAMRMVRISHRMGRHDEEPVYLANARVMLSLARQAERDAPRQREYARADIARARTYERRGG